MQKFKAQGGAVTRVHHSAVPGTSHCVRHSEHDKYSTHPGVHHSTPKCPCTAQWVSRAHHREETTSEWRQQHPVVPTPSFSTNRVSLVTTLQFVNNIGTISTMPSTWSLLDWELGMVSVTSVFCILGTGDWLALLDNSYWHHR